MSKTLAAAALALSLATLVGCAGSGSDSWFAPTAANSPMYTAVSPSAAQSLTILNDAPICCDALSGLRFEPLDTKGAQFYLVDAKSQAFAFSTGKSLVQAFVIPDDLERATVIVEAIAGATVFVPTVLVLDRDHRVSRAIDSSNFRYTPAGYMEPQRLKGKVYLDRRQGGALAAEKYLVIFTTDKDLRGSTRMLSEAKLYARAQGLADPRLPDSVAQHAATGVFGITVGDLETTDASPTRYVRQRRGADRYVAPSGGRVARAAGSSVKSAQRARKPVGKQPMLKETQGLYDRMIRDSVANGDMDRAWRLVQEAERTGSTTARATFVSAVEDK